MKRLYIFIFGILLINTGCNYYGKKNTSTSVDTNWSLLTIKAEDYFVITINHTNDTSIVKSYDNGSIFTGWHKVKVDSIKAYFTMAEKDSLFHLSDDIISKSVRPKIACTDFVGDLELTIYYDSYSSPGAYKKSITYSGICDWDTLSNDTRHLHAILKRRIKWWQK